MPSAAEGGQARCVALAAGLSSIAEPVDGVAEGTTGAELDVVENRALHLSGHILLSASGFA